jgi:P-type Cu+ transporter
MIDEDVSKAEMTVTDPVCGEEIAIGAVAVQQDYHGWAYFFCSAHCSEKFSRQPSSYALSPQMMA